MENPTVSVIIPTYNRADMLVKAIRSVLEQSYQDFEIIIVDDCSTDNTEQVVKFLGDTRVKYIKLNCNSGGSFKPRNLALNTASGRYIAVLDNDSLWLSKDKLKMQVEFLDNNPDYVLVGTNGVSLNLNGEIVAYVNYPTSDEGIRSKILARNCFFHPSVMYRNEAAKTVGGYHKFGAKPYENYSNDYELMLALGCINKVTNLPMYGAGSVLTPRNFNFKERYGFMTSFISLIKRHRFLYPNYCYSVMYWFITMMLDIAALRWLKNKVVRSITNGRT